MAIGGALLYLELLLLFVAFLPLGDGLVRSGERFLNRTTRMTFVERTLISFYAVGGLLFVLGSLPVSWFSTPLVLVVLVAGVLLWSRAPTSWRNLRVGWDRLRRDWPGSTLRLAPTMLVAAAVLLLLVFEVVIVGSMALPNTFDGSVQTEFTQVLLRQGSVGTTLEPYADVGIIYPQGTTVWLATGVLLFAWPVAEASVNLTPLFLALGVAGAYCWGRRLGGVNTRAGQRGGLVFAAVFASLGTWPRFLVGGSYDFVLGIPLFLVLLGWLEPLWHAPRGSWRPHTLYGLLVGVLASLSIACAELLVVLVVVTGLWTIRPFSKAVLPRAGRMLLIAGCGALFLIRSLMGVALWWRYPGHVMTELSGSPLSAPTSATSPLLTLVGLTDPFLYRPIDVWLSPFFLLKVELSILLAGGFVLLSWRALGYHPRLERSISRSMARHLGGVTLSTVIVLAAIVVTPGSGFSPLSAVSSSGEISVLLFVFYTAIATLPLLWAAGEVDRWLRQTPGTARDTKSIRRVRYQVRAHRAVKGKNPVEIVLFGLILFIPLVSGTAVTATQAPVYVGGLLHDLSNVSRADLDTLQWAGTHLPACSGVLVAPGSAGQFLPAYSQSRLIYQMNPTPQNLSYTRAITNLTYGNYSSSVRADLVALGVTEVFATGQSNILWKPLATFELKSSTDFHLLFEEGDASIYEFVEGAAAEGCPA